MILLCIFVGFFLSVFKKHKKNYVTRYKPAPLPKPTFLCLKNEEKKLCFLIFFSFLSVEEHFEIVKKKLFLFRHKIMIKRFINIIQFCFCNFDPVLIFQEGDI